MCKFNFYGKIFVMSDVTSKFGLLYRDNLHTLVGVDVDDSSFNGRVPFGAKAIEDNVFANTAYESFSIPDSVKSVGFNLFENCVNATSIRLPGSLSELTPYMFSGCKRLYKLNMPNVVSEFPEGIFMNCTSLTEVPFRTDIAYIGAKAFLGCSSITNIVFPETVQIIESQAFALCSSLESLVLGSGIAEIADDAFAGCISLCHIRLAEDNPYFELNSDGCVVRKRDGKVVIALASSQKTEVSFVASEPAAETEKVAVWDNADSENEEIEEDDTFSAEIGAGDEEARAFGASVPVEEEQISSPAADIPAEPAETDMVSSILSQNSTVEKEEAPLPDNVSVSMEELASVVDTLNAENGAYTEAGQEKKTQNRNITILCENVGFSQVSDYPSKGLPVSSSELFVFAEKLVDKPDGTRDVSAKLKKCCETLANIHDLKKIIYLAELPLDNEEFLMFLANTLKHQHVLLACEAANPEALSEEGRKICQAAQISLDKNEVLEQRKRAGIKNPGTIKLIVQDRM